MAKEVKNIGASVRARLLQVANDEQKQRQWNAFIRDVSADQGSLEDVVTSSAEFRMPHAILAPGSNNNGSKL